MRAILPPDGGPITVTQAGLFTSSEGHAGGRVLVEITGGPFITLTPHQWNDLVRRIRAAPTASDIGA